MVDCRIDAIGRGSNIEKFVHVLHLLQLQEVAKVALQLRWPWSVLLLLTLCICFCWAVLLSCGVDLHPDSFVCSLLDDCHRKVVKDM